MPAEWEPHEATWIAWPHNRSDWPGKFGAIPWVYADIVRHLSRAERVNLIVRDAAQRSLARNVLGLAGVGLKNISFYLWPTNRVWTRDSGPIFLRRESSLRRDSFLHRKSKVDPIALTDWRFNAWAKYSDWKLDNQLPSRIGAALRLKVFTPMVERNGRQHHVVLEGGSIDVNGQGLMLTTEECLLSRVQERNPGISQKDLEKIFADYLGIQKVVWLGRGIAGDDTHGHVDDIARFVTADTVLAAVEHRKADPNHAPLQDNLGRLRGATDANGRKLQVVELPMPRPVIFEKRRLPASYANFYVANGLVLVPTFNDPNDRIALDILAGVFPGREVVGIHCGDFIWGLGAIHCMTQQQPA